MEPINIEDAAVVKKGAKPTGATNAKAVHLSTRDLEVLAVAWQCIVGQSPSIDYDKFAKALDFKSEKAASIAFGRLKAKLKRIDEGQDSGAKALAARKLTVHKRSADETGSSAEDSTSAKRAKKDGGNDDGQGSTKSVDLHLAGHGHGNTNMRFNKISEAEVEDDEDEIED